jgi:RNA polymerase sigma-70 factor (ECF subfamily)
MDLALRIADCVMSEQGEDLVVRAQDGDLAAFERLVRQYQEMAYAIAYQVVGDADDAHDVCQECFIKLHRVIGQYRPRHRFSTWLYRLIVNTAIDFQRREARARHAPLRAGEEVADGRAWGGGDLDLSLERVLSGLSPKQRSAFVLRDLQGFSLEEVAHILGCSAITVRVHLHNARRQIRERLKSEAEI